MTGRPGDAPPRAIELRVEQAAHLFDTLDPFPVPARDLARNVDEFIVGWARELPPGVSLRLVVHMPAAACGPGEREMLQSAFARYYAERAEMADMDLKELFRTGRRSLAIGLGALVAAIAGGQLIAALAGQGFMARVATEGLFILGWVANWRPVEIFLYDWWPIAQRRRLFRRLAAAPIELRPV